MSVGLFAYVCAKYIYPTHKLFETPIALATCWLSLFAYIIFRQHQPDMRIMIAKNGVLILPGYKAR